MRERGCSVEGVELHYFLGTDGRVCRELRAARDLEPGDVLVSAPLESTLHHINQQPDGGGDGGNGGGSSSGAPGNDEAGGRLAALRRLQARVPAAAGTGRGAWQFKVALELLYHKHLGEASPLAPYLATLPGLCPGVPCPQVAMLWPEEALAELQCAALAADAGGQAHAAREFAADVLAALPGGGDDPFGAPVSEQQLGWSLAVSMSRAFGFRRLGAAGGHALVPLVDMADHAAQSSAEVRCDESGRVRMMANRKVAAGQPIVLRYGSHGSADMLLSYGFVLPGGCGDADRFVLPLDLDAVLGAVAHFVGGEPSPTGRATDGLRQWQRRALRELGLAPVAEAAPAGAAGGAPPAPVIVSLGGNPPVSPGLLAAVRVMLATERSSVRGRPLEELGDWSRPLSPQHEALVMKALVGVATVLYKACPTSIQQDRALLEQLRGGQQREDSQQQQEQPGEAAAAALGGGGEEEGEALRQRLTEERLLAAVQFRLDSKLLLERVTKALLLRLKELTAGQ